MKRRRAAVDTTTAIRVLRSAPHTTLAEAAAAAKMTHTQIRLCVNQATGRGRCAQKTASVLHNSLRHESPWTNRPLQRLLLTHRMCPPPAARAVTAELAAQASAAGGRSETMPVAAGTPGWAAHADHSANTAPASLLRSQAANDDPGVRSVVAGNPALPLATLEALFVDETESVSWMLASNERCPLWAFAKFVDGDDSALHEAVAMNRACPPDLLEGPRPHLRLSGPDSCRREPVMPAVDAQPVRPRRRLACGP